MKNILLRFALLFPFAVFCACSPSSNTSAKPLSNNTTIVLLRHAEKDPETKQLTAKGRANARALPGALADLEISAIYCSDKKRNIETALPLAKQAGRSTIVIPLKEEGFKPESVTRRLLGDYPGKTVVWIGNTWNLEEIYPALGGTGRPPTEYGDLFILRRGPDGNTDVESRKFGN